jgi:hypothetical protein
MAYNETPYTGEVMRTKLIIATAYTSLYKHRAKQTATSTKRNIEKKIDDNRSEIICIAVTSAVGTIGLLAARVAGFNAGYKFAKGPAINP